MAGIKWIKQILVLLTLVSAYVHAAELVDAGFEDPSIAPNDYRIMDAGLIPGWETTASDNKMELWTDGFQGYDAYEGQQFAEIDANEKASIYQDVVTVPGSTLTWYISHRGRGGTDVAEIKIGVPGGSMTVEGTMTTDETAWIVYSGTYTVPAGQDTTRFEFDAISSHGGDSYGNFVDAFRVEGGGVIAYLNSYSTIVDTSVDGNVITDPVSDTNATVDYGDPLTIDSFTTPSNGTLSVIAVGGDGDYTYTPDAGFTGTDTFTYTITDGYGGSSTATVTIDVIELKANDDAYVTDQNTDVSGNVLDNDTYPSGTTITTDTTGLDGTLTIDSSTGVFTYSPTTDFSGTTSFTYTIDDGNGNTSTATVHITVEALIVIPANLVAEYRLDECGFDGTTGDVIDNTINRLNGTTQNSVGKTTEPNKVCKGAMFNGTDQYIEVPHNDKLNFNGGFTVSFWVYITSDTGSLVSKIDTSAREGWDFEIYNSRYIDFDFNGWSNYIRSSSRLIENAWHHIAGVYNPSVNSELILYIDGVKDGEKDQGSALDNATAMPLTIGWGDWDNYYDGRLDEVKIFNRALNSTEISDMYNNENATPGRNWNNDTDQRVCNTCSCPIEANAGILSSFAADFDNMSSNKTVDDKLSSLGTYGTDYKLWRRDYSVGAAPSGNNDASYHEMGETEVLEYGKAYWIRNLESSAKTYEVNLKTMDFDATITNYPECRSANGKCALVDLVSPNGTNNNGPYIYTMTSFAVSKPIHWADVRVLITDGGTTTSYTPDQAATLGETFNATIWKYSGSGSSYSSVTPGIPGLNTTIDPCTGYFIELDKNTAGKNVKLLFPQE